MKTPTFEAMFLFMVTAFGGEVDVLNKRAYELVMGSVPPDVMLAGVNRLIKEAASGVKFYPMPKPHDWLRVCQDEIKHRRREALKHLPECTVCGNTRWVTVKDGDGVERMARCECFVLRLRAADSAGTLLALPARREGEGTE
jgi:hypothetical protein